MKKRKIFTCFLKMFKCNEPIRKVFKTTYSIISVISTFTIFGTLLLFIIGKHVVGNVCDDDLIMKKVQEQLPDNLSLSRIYKQDIHGFGNETMIVLAEDYNANKVANQLLIYDKIENNILNQIYNLYGYGSKYNLSYSFSLNDPNKALQSSFGYVLNILDAVDLTGDLSKEIIVEFTDLPVGTSGYHEIGIFSYSYEMRKYYLLGTFPPAKLYDYENGRKIIATIFNNFEGSPQTNYYDTSEKFSLEYGTTDDNDYFIDNGYIPYLIRTSMIWGTNESHHDPHRHIVSVFTPNYNKKSGELSWNIIFSKETDNYEEYCSKEFVDEFLEKNGYDWIIQG